MKQGTGLEYFVSGSVPCFEPFGVMMSENPITSYIEQSLILHALLFKVQQGMGHYYEANISWDVDMVNQLTPDNQLRLQLAIESLAKGRLYAVVIGITQQKYIISWSKIQGTPMSIEDCARGVKYKAKE